MQADSEQLLERFDRILIDGVQNAEEACCAESVHLPEQHRKLSEQAKCAMIFIKQWVSNAKLPIDFDDLDMILIRGFARSAPAGKHVNEQILWGLIQISSKPSVHDQEADPAVRKALIRVNNSLSTDHRAVISSVFQTLTRVMILLSVDPDEQSVRTAVFLLAKLIDPDLGK
jgi:hypothetical protein